MNIGSILNQVLNSGQQVSQNRDNSSGFNLPGGLGANSSMLKKLGGGAAAAGLLSMLMGNKGGIGINSSMRKMGSMAAIGTLAYKAYQSWHDNKGNKEAQANIIPTHERDDTQVENNSRTIVKAMIAAANADGRIDPSEREAILNEIGQEDAEVSRWIDQQVANPATPEQLANEVGNDKALAAEVYLASRIVSGDLDRKEIVYLHQLSQALGLDDDLVEHLEKQAGF